MSEMSLSSVGSERLVKIIRRAPKGMPEAPSFSSHHAPCRRCGGQGGADVWKFTGWTCYRCGGSGKDPVDMSYKVAMDSASPEWVEFMKGYIEKMNVAAEKRLAKKLEKEMAKLKAKELQLAAFIDSDPVLKAAVGLGDALCADQFAFDVMKTVKEKGFMSDKQKAIIERGLEAVAKKAAEKAEEKPVIEGRIDISGTVISVKLKTNQFGSTLKMLVKDDRGFKVWGSVPRDIRPNRGDKVQFVATVNKSEDDECFGFFSRPTKAVMVESESEEMKMAG